MDALTYERRRDPRTLCSVLSEVLIKSNGHLKYFAPAILADISTSGLALTMDIAPRGVGKLLVRNAYFEVDVHVKNITATNTGFRVGCEFLSPIEWLPDRILSADL